MNVDLLRHQQRWKEGLNGLRVGFATLQAQVSLHNNFTFSVFDSLGTINVFGVCGVCVGF